MRRGRAFGIVAVAAVLAAAAPSRAETGEDPPAGGEASVATFLLPEVGLFFVRYGEPGGVRITSRIASPAPDSISEAGDWTRFATDERIARIFREEYARHLAGSPAATARKEPAVVDAPPPPASPPPWPGSATTTVVLPPAVPPSGPTAIEAGIETEASPAKAETTAFDLRPEEVRDFVRREFRYGGLLRTNLVIFETNKSSLIPYSFLVLDAVGHVLREYPTMRIRVEGHADLRGSDEHNLGLSQRRAESVRRYFIDTFEIEPERVEAAGFGKRRPLVPGTNMTALTLNRRVEFRVLNPEEVFPK